LSNVTRSLLIDGSVDIDVDQVIASKMTRVRISKLSTSLAPLAAANDLTHVELLDPFTLRGLEDLQQIDSLMLYHFPRIRSLEPLGTIKRLKRLHISTPPGYDASRKVFEVESLVPLGRLEALESLTMRGVLPLHDRLTPLYRLRQLLRLDISHVYAFSLTDYALLACHLPDTSGHCLLPYFAASWAGNCPKCGTARVALTGSAPRSPRLLCPNCNQARLAKHVAEWDVVLMKCGSAK
jgi:hypothetical protein